MPKDLELAKNDQARAAADEPLLAFLREQGYRDFRWLEGQGWCALQDYMYTCAIVVGMNGGGYEGRYCYADGQEAERELRCWDGQGDPGGQWIKYKGLGDDRLGPGALEDDLGQGELKAMFDFSNRRVFKVGDRVRYTVDHLARNPDMFKRFDGRIGVVSSFRLGACDPVVEFPAAGRRKAIKLLEVTSRNLELAPETNATPSRYEST